MARSDNVNPCRRKPAVHESYQIRSISGKFPWIPACFLQTTHLQVPRNQFMAFQTSVPVMKSMIPAGCNGLKFNQSFVRIDLSGSSKPSSSSDKGKKLSTGNRVRKGEENGRSRLKHPVGLEGSDEGGWVIT
jgi:hypothetical protein